MRTECNPTRMRFARLKGRDVVADFEGGRMTSDAGALLLGATDRAIGLVDRFSGCFSDGRSADRVVHDVATLVGQRVFGIALGYEDLVDHDELRRDPVLGAVLGRLEARRRGCEPLAGKSTLNRLEHAPEGAHRYRRIGHDAGAIEALFVELFLDAHERAPERLVLDLDATDDPLHGRQEGRFFHGYYDCYCYLPLYIFCGDHLLAAVLRRANIDASAGALEEVQRIVGHIRARWPAVEIVLRADAGFAREPLMAWCEDNAVDYVFGLARNKRLTARLQPALDRAEARSRESGEPARLFTEFRYSTLKTWSRQRRVVGKAEWLPGRANPRFIVTSLSPGVIDRRTLYEGLYCARGEMENRIKECQLDLFADRTSATAMRANQLRLWFASMAYVLLSALRRIALAGTRLARATCGSIRLKLLKVGAQVRLSARRIRIAMASACPHAAGLGDADPHPGPALNPSAGRPRDHGVHRAIQRRRKKDGGVPGVQLPGARRAAVPGGMQAGRDLHARGKLRRGEHAAVPPPAAVISRPRQEDGPPIRRGARCERGVRSGSAAAREMPARARQPARDHRHVRQYGCRRLARADARI